MSQVFCMVILLAGLCTVFSFPSRVQRYNTADGVYKQGKNADVYLADDNAPYYTDNTYPALTLTNKRGQSAHKRASLNQLLQRLIALYGNNDITWSGRSAHVRFGAGGK